MASPNETKRGRAKVNIFDDNISYDAARHIINSSALAFDEDDEDEQVNWDGTPCTTKSEGTNKPPVPDLSSLATPVPSRSSSFASSLSTQQHPKESSLNYGSAASAINFGHNRSRSITFGSKENEKGKDAFKPNLVGVSSKSSINSSSIGSLQDIDDVVGISKKYTSSDVDKMQQEIQALRRTVLSTKRDRWVKLPIEDTLRRLTKGEVYSFEMYKSLEDKLSLLDKAIQRHDGNAITSAVLFLQRTVSRQIFTRELVRRSVAANHYLNFLRQHYDFSEYVNILGLLGRSEEAAIFKYKLALSSSDVSVKLSKLGDSLRTNFKADPQLSNDSSLVQEYLDLIERQRPIDESDANLEAAGRSQLFRDFPRKRSLVDMSVITTLYYCCLYHFDLGENSLGSPVAIRKRHQISEKQFIWTAVSARAKIRHWRDIESLLTAKGWFGGTKIRSVIGFEKIVGILHRNQAPPDILDKYLSLIDDPEERLNLAKKVSCSKSIVDTFVALKDRPALEEYTRSLDRYSRDGLYANDVLSSSSIKWR